jgi:hypothetical protein
LHRDPYEYFKHYNQALALHLSPCKETGPSNWVPGHGGGAAQPIPARPATLPAGQGAGRRACSPRDRWRSELGRGGTLRRRTAVSGGDRRNSGECNTRGRPHAMLGAPGGSMDGAQTIWWLGRHGLVLGGGGVNGGRRDKGGTARHGTHRSGQ